MALLVVQRDWPQQENPGRPLLAADDPAVLANAVVTAVAGLDATDALVADVAARSGHDAEVLAGLVAHALRANGGQSATVRLVVTGELAYVLVNPLAADGERT